MTRVWLALALSIIATVVFALVATLCWANMPVLLALVLGAAVQQFTFWILVHAMGAWWLPLPPGAVTRWERYP